METTLSPIPSYKKELVALEDKKKDLAVKLSRELTYTAINSDSENQKVWQAIKEAEAFNKEVEEERLKITRQLDDAKKILMAEFKKPQFDAANIQRLKGLSSDYLTKVENEKYVKRLLSERKLLILSTSQQHINDMVGEMLEGSWKAFARGDKGDLINVVRMWKRPSKFKFKYDEFRERVALKPSLVPAERWEQLWADIEAQVSFEGKFQETLRLNIADFIAKADEYIDNPSSRDYYKVEDIPVRTVIEAEPVDFESIAKAQIERQEIDDKSKGVKGKTEWEIVSTPKINDVLKAYHSLGGEMAPIVEVCMKHICAKQEGGVPIEGIKYKMVYSGTKRVV